MLGNRGDAAVLRGVDHRHRKSQGSPSQIGGCCGANDQKPKPEKRGTDALATATAPGDGRRCPRGFGFLPATNQVAGPHRLTRSEVNGRTGWCRPIRVSKSRLAGQKRWPGGRTEFLPLRARGLGDVPRSAGFAPLVCGGPWSRRRRVTTANRTRSRIGEDVAGCIEYPRATAADGAAADKSVTLMPTIAECFSRT